MARARPEELERLVEQTLWHEIAHYFGMNETRSSGSRTAAPHAAAIPSLMTRDEALMREALVEAERAGMRARFRSEPSLSPAEM